MALRTSNVLFKLVCGSVIAGAALMTPPAVAETAEDFYKGKRLRMVIGYSAGGGYDAYARILARFIGKHIPGQPSVVAQNMPGAGSLLATNWLYNVAPRDGSVIAAINRGIPFEPLVGGQGIQFDPLQFGWVGSLGKEVNVTIAWHTSKTKNAQDLFTLGLVVGGTGSGADSAIYPALMNNLLGAKIKLIAGYPGGNDVTMAMERGEVDARFGWSWGSLKSRSKPWLDDKKINVLIQMALQKAPDLPDVPLIMDFAKTDLDKKALELLFSPQISAWPLIAPPDVPKERISILRRAFDATMKDPAFLADAGKIQIEVDPVSGETMQQVVAGIAMFDRSVIDRAIELTDAK